MNKARAKNPPVQVIQNVEHLGPTPVELTIRLDEIAAGDLAEYLDLMILENFQAELQIQRWGGRGVAVTGEVSADVTQECVVSLEPVRSHVREIITVRFLPESEMENASEEVSDLSREVWIEPTEEDPPEGFNGRDIDLGAVAVEFLALGLDPYPRAEGAVLQESEDADLNDGESLSSRDRRQAFNAFQSLAALRDKLKG